jgi:hypothetical protein
LRPDNVTARLVIVGVWMKREIKLPIKKEEVSLALNGETIPQFLIAIIGYKSILKFSLFYDLLNIPTIKISNFKIND